MAGAGRKLCGVLSLALAAAPAFAQSPAAACREKALEQRITRCTTGLGECTGTTGTLCSNKATCTRPASPQCLDAYDGGTFRGFHTYFCDNLDIDNKGADREAVLSRICPADPPAAPEAPAQETSAGSVVGGVAAAIAGLYLLDKVLSPAAPAPEFTRPAPAPLPPIGGNIFDPADFEFFADPDPSKEASRQWPMRLFVFHAPPFDFYGLGFTHAEYYETGHLLLAHRDGRRLDIGARVHVPELHRAIRASRFVYIVQTKDRKPVTGSEVELRVLF